MKVQVKRTFKYYFLSPKNNKRADILCIKFSSTFNTSVQRYLYPLFQNHHPIPWFLQNISWIFSQTCISYHCCKKFQIHGFKITGKYISVYLWPQAKVSGFYHRNSRQKKITYFSQTKCFENLFFPSREGEDLKIWPKLNLQGYWSHVLINSIPPFATFTFKIQASWSVNGSLT